MYIFYQLVFSRQLISPIIYSAAKTGAQGNFATGSNRSIAKRAIIDKNSVSPIKIAVSKNVYSGALWAKRKDYNLRLKRY